MKLYIYLEGANKHSAALLMPCGSYQFLYDEETNRHLLDGEAITVERFNEAATYFARHWPETNFRAVPWIVAEEKRARLVKLTKPADAPAPAPALALA